MSDSKDNISRKHHYLPVSYQKGFTLDQKSITRYDIENNIHQSGLSIKKTGMEKDLNTIPWAPKPDELEKIFAGVDKVGIEALRELTNGNCSIEIKANAAQYILLMYIRNPASLSSVKNIYPNLKSQIEDQMGELFKEHDQRVGDMRIDNKGLTLDQKISLFNDSGDNFMALFNSLHSFFTNENIAKICTRTWIITKSTSNKFLTSDKPVYVYRDPSSGINHSLGLTIVSPDAVINFPLDKDSFLQIYNEGDDLLLIHEKPHVAEINFSNKMTALHAYRYLFGHNIRSVMKPHKGLLELMYNHKKKENK